jgi:hypothetical protein
MVGSSGTYAVQGTDFTLQPTSGKWQDRDAVGFDGGGHPIYAAPRTFEMSWQLINASDLYQIIAFYNSVQNTGTVAVDLPKWGAYPYQFERHSGCTLSEPTVGEYFNEHTQSVRMLVYNVIP